MPKLPPYLLRQRNGYYAVLEIPKALRKRFGKSRFKQTLQTDSLKIAESRKFSFVAKWKAEIEAARGNLDSIQEAIFYKENHWDPSDLAWQLVDTDTSTGMMTLKPEHEDQFKILSGQGFYHLGKIEDYEKTLGHLEQKSKDMRIYDIKRFCKKFKFAEDATNKAIKEWIEENLLGEEKLAATTCRRIVSNNRQYWKYLKDKHDLSFPEPFSDVVPSRTKTRKQEVKDKRKHFEPSDFQTLLDCKDSQVVALMKIGAYTGCRIEEICSLETRNALTDRIRIVDAKTEAGFRIVPLHKEIQKLVAELKEDSKDGFLLSGLSYNKYGDRSNAIGKRFGRLKSSKGYGRDFVFHSFRKGVATQFEKAGIPENISANLLGHDIPTMTYGLYSGNSLDFKVLQQTISVLKW